jgi:VIT1/CCC1 family predicted Fe2+/Mn2+ transporter
VSEHKRLLDTWQPFLLELADGSISTLAPVFAAAVATQDPWVAFLVGMAAAIGAAVSMGVSEALSDDGELTGRGAPLRRGLITGGGTFGGGCLHALPFLLPHYRVALAAAVVVVLAELVGIAWLRWRFFPSATFSSSLVQVTLAGAVVFAVGYFLGGV